MTLHDFCIKVNGARLLSLSETEPPLVPHDFYVRYRRRAEWKTEIERIDLIPHGDIVILLITLKR